MKLLFMDWNSFGNEDMIYWLRRLGYEVVLCPFQHTLPKEAESFFMDYLITQIKGKEYDFIFSFNYFPLLSRIAMEVETTYISWTYDNPAPLLFSKTILNPCNRIFVFDQAMVQELQSLGVSNVFYLPLACNPIRLQQLTPSNSYLQQYGSDITFVGSTYSEPKQDFYSRLQGLSDYTKGYLESILTLQQNTYGKFLLYDMVPPAVLQELQQAYPYTEAEDSYITAQYVYVNYFLARHVTAMERAEILHQLSKEFAVSLYTNEKTPHLPLVSNHGKCEYYTEMPLLFKSSKINLNITLKSIQTGIPLRVFDLLGSQAFFLTNYQSEMLAYFEPEKDFVYYESIDDLAEKCRFYLKHPDLRQKIAEQGYRRVCEAHTFEHRILQMMHFL